MVAQLNRIVIFTALLSALCYGMGLSAQETTVYLRDGKVIRGKVATISSSSLNLLTEEGFRSIDRSEIRYQLFDKPFSKSDLGKKKLRPKMELVPLRKKYLTEMDAGITFGNPFALRFGLTEWRNFGDRLHIGVGATWQFYRYSMFTVNGYSRLMLGQPDFVRPFFEGGFGISYYQYVNGLNFRSQIGISERPFGYNADFSPVKQIQFGPGLMLDTGIGVGILTKLQFNATWYELTENANTTFRIQGNYFIGSATLSGSFIF